MHFIEGTSNLLHTKGICGNCTVLENHIYNMKNDFEILSKSYEECKKQLKESISELYINRSICKESKEERNCELKHEIQENRAFKLLIAKEVHSLKPSLNFKELLEGPCNGLYDIMVKLIMEKETRLIDRLEAHYQVQTQSLNEKISQIENDASTKVAQLKEENIELKRELGEIQESKLSKEIEELKMKLKDKLLLCEKLNKDLEQAAAEKLNLLGRLETVESVKDLLSEEVGVLKVGLEKVKKDREKELHSLDEVISEGDHTLVMSIHKDTLTLNEISERIRNKADLFEGQMKRLEGVLKEKERIVQELEAHVVRREQLLGLELAQKNQACKKLESLLLQTLIRSSSLLEEAFSSSDGELREQIKNLSRYITEVYCIHMNEYKVLMEKFDQEKNLVDKLEEKPERVEETRYSPTKKAEDDQKFISDLEQKNGDVQKLATEMSQKHEEVKDLTDLNIALSEKNEILEQDLTLSKHQLNHDKEFILRLLQEKMDADCCISDLKKYLEQLKAEVTVKNELVVNLKMQLETNSLPYKEKAELLETYKYKLMALNAEIQTLKKYDGKGCVLCKLDASPPIQLKTNQMAFEKKVKPHRVEKSALKDRNIQQNSEEVSSLE